MPSSDRVKRFVWTSGESKQRAMGISGLFEIGDVFSEIDDITDYKQILFEIDYFKLCGLKSMSCPCWPQ